MAAGGPPPPPPPFGTECEFAETTAITTTTATTFLTHLTLSSPPVDPGDYFIGWRCNFQQDADPGGNVQVRLLEGPSTTVFNLDGNTSGLGVGKPLQECNQFMGSRIRTLLTQGVQTYTLQVRLDPVTGTPGVDEVALYWACLEFWSFN